MRNFLDYLEQEDPELSEAALQYVQWHKKDREEKAARKPKPCGCIGNKTCEKCEPKKEGVFGSSGVHFDAARKAGIKAPDMRSKKSCGCRPDKPCEKHAKNKKK